MKLFSQLKTSEKISLSFSLIGFFSLLLFLLLINISYFFIWYSAQKQMSFSSMNETYKNYLSADGRMEEVEAFKTYLLSKDTIIIPDSGPLICSPGVTKKVHEDLDTVQNKYFYKDGNIVYFIYTQYFKDIGDVKVFFDITPYISSQLIILKLGLIFMGFVVLFQFFIGKILTRFLLRDLKIMAKKLENVDIHSDKKYINCNLPEHDEIRILAQALNNSYDTIDLQTQKGKQFLSDVSHEFKTPLMGMSSELDVLEKKQEKQVLESKDVDIFFMNSRATIKKLNTLLETLFFLSRIEEENTCLIKKPLFLEQCIQTKIEVFKRNNIGKRISVKYYIPKDFQLEVEENTFSILLDNLISNAIKFSEKEISLSFILEGNTLKIQDTGVGISKDDLEKIWEKFYRKSYNTEGFGIGLYLVKRIVAIYDWKISVESEPGKGTTFFLIF